MSTVAGAGLVGADLEGLGELRRRLDSAAERLSVLTAETDLAVGSMLTLWIGSDSHEFGLAWTGQHRPRLLAATEQLRSAARTLDENLAQQRITSEGRPMPLPGGSPTACAAPGTDGGANPETNPWVGAAADSAGLDLGRWQPELGAEANREAIIDVYRYYGDLYLADPDLQWAGMANAIGPSFAAGFFDIAMFREAAGDLAHAYDQAPPGLIPVEHRAIEALANLSEDELRYYETTFLTMQRDIYIDQAPMHEAYRSGGIDAINQMEEDCLIPAEMARAWEMLDEGKRTGDQSLIEEANKAFLRREQEQIIDRYYKQMYSHSPSGPAFTYLMTMMGTPSIPGAQGYAEAYPIVSPAETPGPERIRTPDRIGPWDIPGVNVDNPLQGTVTVSTPFPDGNLAHFRDRWRLITEDTLPAYLALDSDEARSLAAADVSERIDEKRLSPVDVVERATDWDVRFNQ